MPAKGKRTRTLELIDTQAGGDVSRVVISGVEALPGDSVDAQKNHLEQYGDGLRRLLLSEPYGEPSQSVNLVVRACDPEAQAGYIIMEAMGYPMYSGSNTICTATTLLQTGRIPLQQGLQTVLLESPAGVARIQARCSGGLVQSVTTQGEPAYLAVPHLAVDVPRYGKVRYDVVWSGGFYAMIDAAEQGFSLLGEEESSLAAFAYAFVKAARPEFRERPGFDADEPLPFVHFMGPVEGGDDGRLRARSATYVHPDVVCRSPTGTGTSARLALMAERGEMEPGQELETISPRRNRFTGHLVDAHRIHGQRGWDTRITGRARILARSHVQIDLDDPLVESTDLENILTAG